MTNSNGRSAASSPVRHGRLKRSHGWAFVAQLAALVVVVIVVSAGTVAGVVAYGFTHEITANSVDIHSGQKVAVPPGIAAYPGGFNVLMVGSDTGVGQGDLGKGRGSAALNDVTILVHVSADHTFATAISFPRDMVLPHPKCAQGGSAAGLPLNTALSYGGLACVVTVIESFTGLPIQFAGLITFDGVIAVSDAIGGVDVCVIGDFHDTGTGLDLPAGTSTLSGGTALEFLRSRHGVGDGSDLSRISSQQVYLSSMVRKLEAAGTLSNPVTVYQIATAALANMQLSTSLDSVTTMLSLAAALKSIPTDRIVLTQYPGSTGGSGIFAGKVQPNTTLGGQLIALVKADQPFALGTSGQNRGTIVSAAPTAAASPSGSATPTLPGSSTSTAPTVINGLIGQSAAQQSCSKSRPISDQ
ncbi:MAG: LCP family protein [Actinomycetota bacterium]|nr:LCP family protein [Actinomycetota bacterium]